MSPLKVFGGIVRQKFSFSVFQVITSVLRIASSKTLYLIAIV